MLLLFLLAVIILALGLGLIYKMLNMLEFFSPLLCGKLILCRAGHFLKLLPMKWFVLSPLSDSQEEPWQRWIDPGPWRWQGEVVQPLSVWCWAVCQPGDAALAAWPRDCHHHCSAGLGAQTGMGWGCFKSWIQSGLVGMELPCHGEQAAEQEPGVLS